MKPWREGLWPFLADKIDGLVFRMEDDGIEIKPWEGFRSWQRQEDLWKMGRETISVYGVDKDHPLGHPVTKAKGGESVHNYGLACDIVFVVKGEPSWADSNPWGILGQHAESLGICWGARMGRDPMEEWDKPHFQITCGLSIAEMKRIQGGPGGDLQPIWDEIYRRLMSY